MTEDVSAGRLHIEAYADTTGVTRGMQRRLDAEMASANVRAKVKVAIDTRGVTRGMQRRLDAEMASANVRAKVKVAIDARGAVGEVRKAAAEATKAARDTVRIRVRMAIDRAGLAQEVRKAAAEASANAQVNARMSLDPASVTATNAAAAAGTSDVNVNADTTGAAAELAAFRAYAEANGIDVDVDPDTARASGEMAAWRASQQANPVAIPVKIDKGAGDALMQLSKIPMLAGGFYTLGAAIVSVGGGLVAMASSAASAAGALAAIPNLIGAAAQGIGVLVAGFSGVGEAVTALGAAEAAAGTDATASAQARVAAADRVRSAQQSLGDAMQAAGNQARASAEAVSDAQWSLARAAEGVTAAREALSDAHYNAAQAAEDAAERITDAEAAAVAAHKAVAVAQRDLTRAREDARDRIEDMNEALRLSRLDEEGAMNALIRARENLQDVEWNASASPQERRDAEMAVQEAEAGVERIKSANEELAEDVAEANRKGVKGSEEVKSAQASLTAAQQAQKDAIEAISEARQNAKRVAVQNARSIRDAEYGVRDALHAQGEAREALTEAQIAQGQGAQDSAEAVANAQRELRRAQQAATDVANEQTASQLALKEAMDNLSPAGQRFAKFIAATLLPRLKQMKFAIQEALLPGVQTGVRRALPLLDVLEKGLEGTARRIGGFAAKLGKMFGRKTFGDDVAQIMKSNNRALGNFLPSIKNLIVFMKDLAKVAGPSLVEPFAKWFRELTHGWRVMLRTEEGQKRLADWFDKVRARVVLLRRIFVNLSEALFGIGKAASPTGDSLLGTFADVTERWAKWANSDLGKARMEEFFETVKPVTVALGDLIAQVAELFVKLGEGGASPLTAFLVTLTKMVEGITWLLDTVPGLSKIVGWFMILAGVGGALGFAGGMIMKMGANIVRVGKVLRPFLKFLSGIGKVLLWVAMKVGPMLLRILPLIGRAFALMLGPWGIAIALVVGGFILMYKKVEWFRKAVDWVMGKVVDAFNWVVDGAKHLWDVLFGHSVFPDIMDGLEGFWGIVKRIFGFVIGVFKRVAKVARWLWTNAFKPAFRGIGKVVEFYWDNVLKPVFKFLWEGLKEIGWWAKWLWNNAIKPAWNAISDGIQRVWDKHLKPIFKFLWQGLKNIGSWAKWLWNNAIRPAWNSISDAIDNAWNKVIKPAFTAMRDFVTKTLPDAFSTGVGKIKEWWGDLKDIATRPIKFMVETLWNNGLRAMISAIPGVDELDPINTSSWASGTARVLPGHTPGRDVHHFTSPTGGRLNLSGGEAIMRPEFTDTIGERGVNFLNAAARHGKKALSHAIGAISGKAQHYATGGVYSGSAEPQRHATGGVYSAVDRVLSFFAGGVMPLTGGVLTDDHGANYYGADFAGDFNSPNDLAVPPATVVAWKPGTVAQVNPGSTSYGNHIYVNHAGGVNTLYAHLSSFMSRVGQSVGAGDVLGRVGATGKAFGAHLHFEIDGGFMGTGSVGAVASGSGSATAVPTVGGNPITAWKDAIGTVKDLIGKAGNMISTLREKAGPWADHLVGGAKSMGANVIQWINDKIPNRLLPDNPIPNIFDRGGDWKSGVLGLNMSGTTETVFTNTDMVELGASLRATALVLRSMIGERDSGRSGGDAPLVGELTLMGRPEDMPNLLADANLELRRIRRGGVHAQRTAGAPA